MTDDQWIVIANSFVMPLIGLTLHWVTKGCATGAFQRNSALGIRVRGTLASDAGWVAGHQAALPWTRKTWWFSIAATLATVGLTVLVSPDWGMACYLLGLAGTITAACVSSVIAHQAGKAATPAPPETSQ